MKTILIIEDDENLGKGLISLLLQEGFNPDRAKTLTEARAKIRSLNTELLIRDWMLPDGQGIDLLREIRQQGNLVPVILLTARSEVIDKVLGLEMGANDYLTKPFDPRELIARVRARLSESNNEVRPIATSSSTNDLVAGPIRINLDERAEYF